MLKTNTTSRFRSRELQMREAALSMFCDPSLEMCTRLQHLSAIEWRRLLLWLDTSGLALYFLDRLTELNQTDLLPPHVLARLQQNLADNTTRMKGMFAELSAIHREFQRSALRYAILKGFSLCPISVPRPELRSQLDLDFLIAEENAREAQSILERRGYHLRAISGRSWEFKTNEMPGASLKSLYKNVPYRSVELHLEASGDSGSSLLARAEMRHFCNLDMPVLSSADLFLGQGMHAFKHVCSEFSRTAHLVEFRRHVVMRRDDAVFWSEVQARAEESPRAAIALGVITLIITHLMGDFAPAALTSWTVDYLPAGARLWVQFYGERAVLGSFPGSKLYLLLLKELASCGVPTKRSPRQALLPLRLPPPIVHAKANETPSSCLRRYLIQTRFVLFRLRFHTVEGLRYLRESFRWQQHLNEVTP
ncbi:MAG TPA: nucleotidyltransferase family protein [Acidobacteriaceae bacterium]